MDPIGFLLGITTFSLAVRFKRPLRKAAVAAASQILLLSEEFRRSAYGLKEEVEDIVAEAQYENMKNRNTAAVPAPEASDTQLQ